MDLFKAKIETHVRWDKKQPRQRLKNQVVPFKSLFLHDQYTNQRSVDPFKKL